MSTARSRAARGSDGARRISSSASARRHRDHRPRRPRPRLGGGARRIRRAGGRQRLAARRRVASRTRAHSRSCGPASRSSTRPGAPLFDSLSDGESIRLVGNQVWRNGTKLADGVALDEAELEPGACRAAAACPQALEAFADNTLRTFATRRAPSCPGSTSRRCDAIPRPARTRHRARPGLQVGSADRAPLHPRLQAGARRGRRRRRRAAGGGPATDVIVGDFDSVSDAALRARPSSSCTPTRRPRAGCGAAPGPRAPFHIVVGAGDQRGCRARARAREGRRADRRGRYALQPRRVPRAQPRRAWPRRSSPGCRSGSRSSTRRASRGCQPAGRDLAARGLRPSASSRSCRGARLAGAAQRGRVATRSLGNALGLVSAALAARLSLRALQPMFDFRYHVASLAAVFVALVLGILVGVGLSGSGFVNDAERSNLAGPDRRPAGERDGALARSTRPSGAASRSTTTPRRPIPSSSRGRLDGKRSQSSSSARSTRASRTRSGGPFGDAGGRVRSFARSRVPLDAEALDGRSAPADTRELAGIDTARRSGGRWGASSCRGAQPRVGRLKGVFVGEQYGRRRRARRGGHRPSCRAAAGRDGGLPLRPLQGARAGAGAGRRGGDGRRASRAVPAFRRGGLSTVDSVDAAAGRLALVLLLAGGRPGSYGVDDNRSRRRPPPPPPRRAVSEPLTVLIAARDEEDGSARTVATLREAFPEATIVVADDGSRDATAARRRGCGRERRPSRGVARVRR